MPTQSSVEAQSAPADEYFGRSGESVLGIRNRLNALDQKSDSDILSRGTSTELDDLQDAVLDWQQKYPADPWIPTAMARLVSDYARAGDASSPFATATLRVMLDRYPNTPQTRAAVAAIGNEASPTGNSVLQSAVADTEVPTVPTTDVADVADVAIDQTPVLPEATDLLATSAWQAFNAGRADDASSDSVAPQTTVGVDTTVDSSGDATVDGAVIDARTGAPIAGAIVFVAPDKDSNDVTQTPFATTGIDGSFTVAHVPMGTSYSIGDVSLAHAEFVVVQPPRGSGYIAYHGIVDAGSGTGQAGVIRLTSE
ncbi:MAG TPA: hypothetical protein VIJ12_08695 [Candidatus Baltobacteraceae bacterium]